MSKAIVDPSECRGCGCCVRSCPIEALRLGRKVVEVKDNCVMCGSCAKACPFNAISVPERD